MKRQEIRIRRVDGISRTFQAVICDEEGTVVCDTKGLGSTPRDALFDLENNTLPDLIQ